MLFLWKNNPPDGTAGYPEAGITNVLDINPYKFFYMVAGVPFVVQSSLFIGNIEYLYLPVNVSLSIVLSATLP